MSDQKITKEKLAFRQSLPLEAKIELTSQKIDQWYNHWDGMIYVAFSGGKDSTVLLDILRNKTSIPEVNLVPACFCDTGLEFPENREFVKSIDNVIWLRPKLNFKEVIEKYGYPVVSKEQSQYIWEYVNTNSSKLKDIRINGNKWGRGKISKKWKFLIDAPFKVSHKCCYYLKKYPAIQYEKEIGRHPILGTRVNEGALRRSTYLRNGCNAYDASRPVSTPLAFWKEEDIWNYIKTYGIPYSKIYDMGYDETGCMFCMFGIHREEEPNRFQKMKATHPKLYKYCIECLEIGKILDYIGIEY